MTTKTIRRFVLSSLILGLLVGGGLIVGNVSADNSPAPTYYAPLAPAPGDVGLSASDDFDVMAYDDVLMRLHEGLWFGWSDSSNKIYENLIIHDGKYGKPSKVYLDAELLNLQTVFDDGKLLRDNLKSNKEIMEAKFLNDTYTDADIIEYLRLLGEF